jgi:hypothetical protein
VRARLRRMRAMELTYHALCFRPINFWIAFVALLLGVSLLEPLRAAIFLLPEPVVYAAMQGALHFHHIVFARRYARAPELKINQLKAYNALIAHRLEEAYWVPLAAPRRVGVSWGNRLPFFSAMTLLYGIAGTLTWAFALYRAW